MHRVPIFQKLHQHRIQAPKGFFFVLVDPFQKTEKRGKERKEGKRKEKGKKKEKGKSGDSPG